jgi:hypothetical protein
MRIPNCVIPLCATRDHRADTMKQVVSKQDIRPTPTGFIYAHAESINSPENAAFVGVFVRFSPSVNRGDSPYRSLTNGSQNCAPIVRPQFFGPIAPPEAPRASGKGAE